MYIIIYKIRIQKYLTLLDENDNSSSRSEHSVTCIGNQSVSMEYIKNYYSVSSKIFLFILVK